MGPIMGLGSAVACYLLAKAKHRNPWSWAVWGLVGGLFAIVTLLIVTKSPKPTRSTAPVPQPARDPLRTLAILADMRDKGILTEQEFDWKKSELLNQI